MVYITGDIHAETARIESFCKRKKTTKDDILIILGDAGINYFGDQRDDKVKLRLAALPITILAIHGNHEIRPGDIPAYDLVPWNGGVVYQEKTYPRILFAKDGELYNIAGKSTLVIGGAYSVDKYFRLQGGMRWWANEQPDNKIKADVINTLNSCEKTVDVVLSHTCPKKYLPVEVFLPFVDQSTVDYTTETWLDKIEEDIEYKKWYCGHYHTNKRKKKIEFLFEKVKIFTDF